MSASTIVAQQPVPEQTPAARRIVESARETLVISASVTREALEAEQQRLALAYAAYTTADSCLAMSCAREDLHAGKASVVYLWSFRRSMGPRSRGRRDWAVAFQRPVRLPPLGYVELALDEDQRITRRIFAPDSSGAFVEVGDLWMIA